MTQVNLPVFEPITLESAGGLRILLYGSTNSGKTSFGVSAWHHEDLRKVGIFNIDDNLHTAIAIDDNQYVAKADVHSAKQIEDIAKGDLIGKYDEFNTWICDSLSRLIDYELRDIAQTEYNKKPSERYTADINQWQDYMKLTARLARMIDVLTQGGKHILFTAESQDIDPDPAGQTEKIRTRKRQRRARMNPALWDNLVYRLSNIWYINRLENGDINLLVKSFMAGDSREIFAKTKNKKFLEGLIKMERDDAKGLGLIRLANAYNPEVAQITFADIYNLYLTSTNGE